MPLGQSPLEISRIVFGSMRFQSAQRADRVRVVHAAIDSGLTSLDTAPLYEFGEIEIMLGDAIRDRRDRVEILTKTGLRWDGDHGDILFEAPAPGGTRRRVRRDGRPASIRKDVEESLSRLRTDRIDLCQIHQPDRLVPIEDSLGELSRLVAEGKVREIGVSNFSPSELRAAVANSDPGAGRARIVSHQLHYSLLERSAEQEMFPLARQHGIGLLAYSPLEAGLLAGKLLESAASPAPPTDFRLQTPVFHPSNTRRIHSALRECVEPIARAHDASLAQICLAWLLAQPDLTGVVAGASSIRQVQALAGASHISLAPDEIQRIDTRFAALRIDPNAGVDWPQRALHFARRFRGKIRRTLGVD